METTPFKYHLCLHDFRPAADLPTNKFRCVKCAAAGIMDSIQTQNLSKQEEQEMRATHRAAVIAEEIKNNRLTPSEEFAAQTGFNFFSIGTGGNCSAIYAETETHEIYITNNNNNAPRSNSEATLGVYLKFDSEQVCEILTETRDDLTKLINGINAITLGHLIKELINNPNNRLTKKDN